MRWDGRSTISRSAGSAPAAPRRRAGSNACGEPSVSRLVSELRLEEASTLEDANAVLATYLPRHNRRFGVPAEDPELAWRPLPAGVSAESVFCFWYPRRVANDATLAWGGGRLALPRSRDGRSWAGRSVIVEERLRRQPVGQPCRRALPAGRGTTRSCRPPCPGPLAGGRGQAGSAGRPHAARASRGSDGPPAGWSEATCSGSPVASMIATESLAAWMTKSLAADSEQRHFVDIRGGAPRSAASD